MRKLILSAAAVAALAMGGVAQADVIDGVGNTISRLFGVPYDPTPANAAPIVNVYTDPQGRHFQVDANGRHIPLGQYGSYRDQWGRTVYLGANRQPFYVEHHGRLTPYDQAAGAYAMGPTYDRDRDGIADRYDRAPDDPRYR